jgi:hypothetical protein
MDGRKRSIKHGRAMTLGCGGVNRRDQIGVPAPQTHCSRSTCRHLALSRDAIAAARTKGTLIVNVTKPVCAVEGPPSGRWRSRVIE